MINKLLIGVLFAALSVPSVVAMGHGQTKHEKKQAKKERKKEKKRQKKERKRRERQQGNTTY